MANETRCEHCGTPLNPGDPSALHVPREGDGERHHVIRCRDVVRGQRDEARDLVIQLTDKSKALLAALEKLRGK